MSKRGMDTQGGEERYGAMDNERDTPDDKPRQATAAQLARRKIAQAKGRPGRSRQPSPAVPGQAQANPFQSFQPPPSASGFNFSVAGSTPSPAFGQAAPPQQNGGFGSPAPEQTNGTPSFGGFSGAQNNAAPSFGSGFGANNTQPQQNSFNQPTSFNFGQNQTNGSAATPNTSFTFGQTQNQSQEQPKQNGFNPTPSFGFDGQQSQQTNGTTPSFNLGPSQTSKPSTPSFGGFGQQTQTNGDKSAGTGLFGSTLATDQAPKSNESIFSGISAASNGVKPGMFTALQQTNGEQTPKPSNPFAGLSFGQQNKEKEQETPKPAFSFGGQNKQDEVPAQKPLFSLGQQSLQNGEQTPKPSFTGFGQQQPLVNGEQTPKPTNAFSGFTFGQQEQAPAQKPAEVEKETPKVGNFFGNIGQQKEPEKPASTFTFGQTQEQQTPKPAGNIFSGLGQSQPTGTSAFKFGASQQEDTSMMSPDNTPQKQSSAQATSQPAAIEPETPANPNAGKSLFDRITRDPPATAPKPSFSFGASAASASEQSGAQGKNLFEPEPPATAPKPTTAPFSMPASSSMPPPPLFNAPSAVQGSAHQSASSAASSSATPADRTKLKELNEGVLAHLKTEDPSKDWSVIFQYYMDQAAKLTGKEAFKAPTTAPQLLQPAPQALPPTPQAPQPTPAAPQPAHQAPPTAPSSGSFGGGSGFNALHSRPTAPAPGMVQMQAPAPPGRSNYAQPPSTPAAPSTGNVFSQFTKPPATAPVNRKRSADENLTRDTAAPEQPATEKRARPSESVQYPKLPETASKTAQLFASTLDKPSDATMNRFGPPDAAYNEVQKQKAAKEAAQKAEAEKPAAPSSAFKPATSFKYAPGAPTPSQEYAAEMGKASGFGLTPSTPATAKPAETPKAPTFGFTPSTSTAAAPATGSFKPTFTVPAAGSANFLSAFGKKADSEQEKAKKRRMDEDYDSDDEDKASWEAKDREEQEAKRRKIEEAAKSGPIFALPPAAADKPASSAPFAFKLPEVEKEKPAQAEEPANLNAGKSLFDRMTPATPAKPASNGFGSKTGGKPFTGFSFGNPQPSGLADTDKSQAAKEQGSGNNTWSPSTPIKFGGAPTGQESTTPAAPPPTNPFAGLFGSKTNGASDAGKLAPPSVGFNFGGPKGVSTDVSRATTPGLTTDGETSTAGDKGEPVEEGEPSDQPNEKQLEDMTQLLPEEREAEDVLFEATMAKASKYDEKKTEDGYVQAWVEKGRGPLYVLKNKTTGRTRVLLKIPPLGRAAMNFAVVKGLEYTNEEGRKTFNGTFFDHMEPNKEKAAKPSTWSIQVREASTAAEIAKILSEESKSQ